MEADFLEDTPEDQIDLISTENVNDRDTNFDADHNGDGDHSDKDHGDLDHVDGDLGDGDHSEDGDHGEDGDHYDGDHGAGYHYNENLGVKGLGAGDHGAGAGDHYDRGHHDYPINQVNQSIKNTKHSEAFKNLGEKISEQNKIISNLASYFKVYTQEQQKITAEIKVKLDILLERQSTTMDLDSDIELNESSVNFPLCSEEEMDTFNEKLKQLEYRMKIVSSPFYLSIQFQLHS